MEIVLLIGAQPYVLDEEEAQWLESRIRTTCTDDLARPHDPDAQACLQLADVLADDLSAGEHAEPIELGLSHAVGLTEHVLTAVAAAEHEMEPLYAALLRFRG